MARAFIAAMFAITALNYITHTEELHRQPREAYEMSTRREF